MSIKRTTNWLVLLGSLLLTTSSVQAQVLGPDYAYGNAEYSDPKPGLKKPHQPFAPMNFETDWQPFAPADISEYGNGPKPRTGFYGSYERLSWSISRPPTATVGSKAAEGLYAVNGVFTFEQNSFDTGFLNSDFGWGNRYDMGYRDRDGSGWLVSVIANLTQNQGETFRGGNILFNDPNGLLSGFIDANGDGFDDDINGNGVFGRDGQDTTVPPDGVPDGPVIPPYPPGIVNGVDPNDLVPLLSTFTDVKITNKIAVSSVELMRTYRVPQFHNGANVELLYGARFMEIYDRFNVLGIGGFLDTSFWSTTIRNDIVGPQIGARWSMQRGRWVVSTEGRFFAGFNMQNGKQTSRIASQTTTPATGQNVPYALTAYSSTDTSHNNEFSPAGEFRIQTSYTITKSVAVKLGYTLLYVDNVARATDHVDWSLPNFGILPGHGNYYFLANGISLGVEVNR